MAGQRIFVETIESCAVLVVAEGDMSDAEWAVLTGALRQDAVRSVLGGALGAVRITAGQRKEVGELVKERKLKVSTLADSAITRGIITAISWVGVDIKAFSNAHVDQAVAWLGADAALGAKLRQTYQRLEESARKLPAAS
jgi:hypothetical protein